VDPSTIEVSMDKSILTIKGERTVDNEKDGGRLTRQERVYGTFHRRFSLPESADAENISAHGRFGVLEIAIPKKPETTPRRIAIDTGN
jgi:HSP20 family protein